MILVTLILYFGQYYSLYELFRVWLFMSVINFYLSVTWDYT